MVCNFQGILAKYGSMGNGIDTGKIAVLMTAPNEEEAAAIACALVEAKLAACVNLVKGVRSIYSWQGKTEDASEVLMIAKTRQELFEALAAKVKELHSYDVPEIIALPVLDGSADYLEWISDSTQ